MNKENSDCLVVYDIVCGSIYSDGVQPPFNLRKMIALYKGWKPCSDIKSSEEDTVYQEFCKEIPFSQVKEFFEQFSDFYEDGEFTEFFDEIFCNSKIKNLQKEQIATEQETTKDLDKLLTEVNGWFE